MALPADVLLLIIGQLELSLLPSLIPTSPVKHQYQWLAPLGETSSLTFKEAIHVSLVKLMLRFYEGFHSGFPIVLRKIKIQFNQICHHRIDC